MYDVVDTYPTVCVCPDNKQTKTDTGVERSAEASLAIAEMKLAQRSTFAPRLESVEGGADYVSASIVDSLLLQKLSQKTTKKQ